jgi:hypothetical protein
MGAAGRFVLRALQPEKQSEELNESLCGDSAKGSGCTACMLDRRSIPHHVFYQREVASCRNQYDWLIDWLILSSDSL